MSNHGGVQWMFSCCSRILLGGRWRKVGSDLQQIRSIVESWRSKMGHYVRVRGASTKNLIVVPKVWGPVTPKDFKIRQRERDKYIIINHDPKSWFSGLVSMSAGLPLHLGWREKKRRLPGFLIIVIITAIIMKADWKYKRYCSRIRNAQKWRKSESILLSRCFETSQKVSRLQDLLCSKGKYWISKNLDISDCSKNYGRTIKWQ